MSNRTYICTNCRTSKRAEASYGLNNEFRCVECNSKMIELPWRWRIPKKSDEKEWNKIYKMICELNEVTMHNKLKEGNKLISDIDKKIDKLLKLNDTATNIQKIKELRWKKKEIEKKYF